MKKMKRFATIAAATVMAVSMVSISAFAATTESGYTITVNDGTAGYTYEAYQVFTGSLSGTVLTNIKWGDGVDGSAIVTDLANSTTLSGFTPGMTAAQVAEKVEEYDDGSAEAQAFAKIVGANLTTTTSGTVNDGKTISNLPAGYYIVKNNAVPENGSYTNFMLKISADKEVTPKRSVPTLEKKVLEESFNATIYGKGYNDVADYDIGDDVPFELIGTLPNNFGSYETYSYTFTDTLGAGLTFNGVDSVKVYYDNDNDLSNGFDGEITSNFTTTADGVNAQKFTVSCDNIKDITGITADSKIIVQYTAELNTDAVIGLDGNVNTANLTYSNNPNNSGAGNTDTGKTPDDKVIVFTYQLDTTKVDASTSDKLQGAKFKLMRNDSKWAIVDENGKVTGWSDTEAGGTELVSDANGLFSVIGIDDGVYELKETEAPANYNKLTSNVKLTIAATTANNQAWNGTANTALTGLTIKVGNTAAPTDGNLTTGTVSTTIKNNKGSTLPETGGIGTKIFTVAGGTIVVGAGVLLITKKRMKKED